MRGDARNAILAATDRILADKPSDEEAEFAVQGKALLLGDPKQVADFAAELKRQGREKFGALRR